MRFECRAEDLILVKKTIKLLDSQIEEKYRHPFFLRLDRVSDYET
jgi:hypothetical protein